MIRLEDLTASRPQRLLAENRENVRESLASVRDLTASLKDVVATDRVKVERLLDGLDGTRTRADRVLYQADQIAGQACNHPGPQPRRDRTFRDQCPRRHRLG